MSEQTRALSVVPEGATWTERQVNLIRKTVAAEANDDELALFLHRAHKMGLDPFSGQIHCVKRAGKIAIQTGIDGYRLVADRTGKYAGNDDPQYGPDEDGHPSWARVTVWKIVEGQARAFTATALWKEYAAEGGQGFMWRKMPYLMLGKVAEALALRKAFPADLSGVYIKEEMDQADAEAEQPAAPAPSQPKAAQAPARAGNGAIYCVDCKKPILPVQIGKGLASAEAVAARTLKEFGRELCYSCGQKMQAAREREKHEAAVAGSPSAVEGQFVEDAGEAIGKERAEF